jgi:hypothetical protein
MLYPMTRSGSTSSIKSRQACNISASSSNDITCEPTMCEHVFKVKILRMNGLVSPWKLVMSDYTEKISNLIPCLVTMLAIWMTGSTCASGKIPFRPAHSISKLSIRRGANFCQFSSGGCEMKASHLVQDIIRHLYTRQNGVKITWL